MDGSLRQEIVALDKLHTFYVIVDTNMFRGG